MFIRQVKKLHSSPRMCGITQCFGQLKTTTLCLETRYILGIDYYITEHQQIV